jgi:[acyl-carrier-protein] S-malonyltransferase
MLDIIFNGPEDELKKTEFTQPAILSVSLAILRILDDKGIKPDGAIGLSLGEYGALTASGVFTVEEVIPLVRKRGKLMQEAVPQGKGTMAAIIGLDRENLVKVINEASNYGIVEAVNYNCPGQVSIAGEINAVEKAVEISKGAGF